MLTKIDKALAAGATAAVAAFTASASSGGGVTQAVELAIGTFVVVSVVTFIVPNKTS